MTERTCPGWKEGVECGAELERWKQRCDKCRDEARAESRRRHRQGRGAELRRQDRRKQSVLDRDWKWMSNHDLHWRIENPQVAWDEFLPTEGSLSPTMAAAGIYQGEKRIALVAARWVDFWIIELHLKPDVPLRQHVPGIYAVVASIVHRYLPRDVRIQALVTNVTDRWFLERLGFMCEGRLARFARNTVTNEGVDVWMMRLVWNPRGADGLPGDEQMYQRAVQEGLL